MSSNSAIMVVVWFYWTCEGNCPVQEKPRLPLIFFFFFFLVPASVGKFLAQQPCVLQEAAPACWQQQGQQLVPLVLLK